MNFGPFCMVQTAWADPEENKRLAREFYQNLWFNENTDRYADYLADEYVIHDIGADGLADIGPVTHVRLNIFPDGGVARLRVAPGGRAALEAVERGADPAP